MNNILYFTRTGHTKKTALNMHDALSADVYQLKDDVQWQGLFGFLRGGKYARQHKIVDIQYDQDCLNCQELIVLSPVWASTVTPAVHTFLQAHPDVHLVVINLGSNMDKVISKVNAKYPGLKSVHGITRRLDNENQTIEDLRKLIES